jgi:hypothetical protein
MKTLHRAPMTFHTLRIISPIAWGLTAALACQLQPDRDLGTSAAQQSGDLSATPPGPLNEPFGGSPSDFVGRWVGVAQNPLTLGDEADVYTFPSGSSQIVLDLSLGDQTMTASLVVGSITFGEPAPVPPPDPALGYPSDAAYARLDYFFKRPDLAATYPGPLPPYEGFTYQGGDHKYSSEWDNEFDPERGVLADGVLRFGFDTEQLLGPWCELQKPIVNAYGEYACVKGDSANTDENGVCTVGFNGLSPEDEATLIAKGVNVDDEVVDCGKLFLCNSHRCTCEETGCYGTFERSGGQLQLRREGDALAGVFSNVVVLNPRGLTLPLTTVRFERLP